MSNETKCVEYITESKGIDKNKYNSCGELINRIEANDHSTMREISSSFSVVLLSPSTTSRDPDGINLPEDYGTQLEPSGTISDEINDLKGTSPLGTNDGQMMFDMKKIIGLPPPPPKSKPPKKEKVRRSINNKPPNSPSLTVGSSTKQKESTAVQKTRDANFTISKPAARFTSSSLRAQNIVEERHQFNDVIVPDESNPGEKDLKMESLGEMTVTKPRIESLEGKKSDAKQQKRAKKRGFFKKMFGGSKSPENTQSGKDKIIPSVESVAVDQPKPTTNDPLPTTLRKINEATSSVPSSRSSLEVTKERNLLKNNFSFDADDVKSLKMEESVSAISEESRRKFQEFSLDPPDDDNGDPPEFSGRPLGSPMYMDTTINDEEEQMRLDTVRSRIAEVYGDHEQQLTIESADADLAKSLEEECLRVETSESRCMDPAGASPIEQYTRGKHVVGLDSGDPQGDTPKARQNSRILSNDPAGVSLCHGSTTPKYSLKPEILSPNVSISDSISESNFEGKAIDEEAQQSIIASEDHLKNQEPNHPMTEIVEGPVDSDTILFQKDTDFTGKAEIDSLVPGKEKQSMITPPDRSNPDGHPRSSKMQSLSSVVLKKNDENKENLIAIEKSGFKSVTNIAADLTVSAAAFTNAKAIAYIHQLQGEPSPRHTYHANHSIAPPLLENPAALAKIRAFCAKKKKGIRAEKQATSKCPSPNEYSAANAKIQEELKGPQKRNYVTHDPKKKFAPYSRFQGRRPRRKKNENDLEFSTDDSLQQLSPKPNDTQFHIDLSIVVPGNNIATMAVSRGLELRKKSPERSGEDKSSKMMVERSRFNFFPAHESEIKNPIQRAGRRLLSKSAVPIQAKFRMYLCRREALARMWGIIRIQSYFRRWKCEGNLRAHKNAVLLVQKIIRGHKHREQMKVKAACATSIQKIVRGYLAALQAYETIYFVTRAQAVARGYLTRTFVARRNKAVLTLQAFFLNALKKKNQVAIRIQRFYREYILRKNERRIQRARTIIIVQSVARRWAACRNAGLIRKSVYTHAITKYQALWRGYADRDRRQKSLAAEKLQSLWKKHIAKNQIKKNMAATKIQASWRGFQSYSDFVFAIVDILVVQRTARQWLASRKTNKLREERAATVLQSAWRRKKAQFNLLYSLVSVIIVQSVARRFLTKNELIERRKVRDKSALIQRNKEVAATTIQKSWRGFWGFSHFIIVKYDVTRIQALVRGKLARDEFNFRVGCAILIQAVGRRFLAQKILAARTTARSAADAVGSVILASRAFELRERNSAKQIQFWWRIVMDYMKEKKAALVIERFFIFVKSEVEREIQAMEQERIWREKARKKQKSLKGDFVDKKRSNAADTNRPEVVNKNGRSKSAQRSRQPKKKLAPNHSSYESFQDIRDNGFVDTSRDMDPMPDFLQLAPSADYTMISNLTNPTILDQYVEELKTPRTPKYEEKYKEVKARPKNKMSTDDYIKKYSGGLQTAANNKSKSQSQHFFCGAGNFNDRRGERQSYDRTLAINAKTRSKISASRNGRAQIGKPVSLSTVGLDSLDRRGVMVPSTPRSRSGSTTPRGVLRTCKDGVPSQFRPPVTPTMKKSAAIIRAGTADTECSTFDNEKMSIPSRPSPPTRHYSTHSCGGKGVMIMKTNPNFMEDNKIQEAHEVMLLGDEYGEV
ncbi:unnamed protein product [Pseudo-nitzschia multistriata]|uniref:Uncharacterized protein n=1 Tax=Pseudo-nitzschia multistriata TaxID=183589 RepID=A0A448ZQ13_9STRA|nr:unnamed protein product [Pseudo-nitzschia multistriata]